LELRKIFWPYNISLLILKNAVEHVCSVRQIDLDGVFKNRVVTLLVMSRFLK